MAGLACGEGNTLAWNILKDKVSVFVSAPEWVTAKGMLPKVEAAVRFAESAPGRTALITLLEKAKDGIQGKTGTTIK